MGQQPVDPQGMAGSGLRRHPVAVFTDRLDTRLDELAEVSFLSMSETEKRQALTGLMVARSKLEALQLRLLADAERSHACTHGSAANAAGFMAMTARQTRRGARADLNLATRLEDQPVLAAAMAAGEVNTAQARSIVAALDRLPSTGEYAVTAEQRAHAERHLVALAASHDADEIAALGRKLFEVVAPEAADAWEGQQLEAEEAKAARKTTLELWEDAQGVCHGRFRIPARHAAMLRKAILSLTNPVRRDSSTGSPIDPQLPTPVRQGVAFTQIIEAIDSRWLPTSGGVGATVVVTMTLEQLLGDLQAAGVCALDTGGRISAGEARRLACSAGIIPMVLGRGSVVLDAGARARFHTEPMRTVIGARDRVCTAEGCDVPASMCHVHHDIPASHGGPTSVANGRLLCGHHHRRVHDSDYRHEKVGDNQIRFHRRT